jgi:hypothetical protein
LEGGEGRQHAAACSKLLDLVAERGFRHLGQLELLAALCGAKSRAVGDARAWSRKASSGDAALVVALTLALAIGSEIPVDRRGHDLLSRAATALRELQQAHGHAVCEPRALGCLLRHL